MFQSTELRLQASRMNFQEVVGGGPQKRDNKGKGRNGDGRLQTSNTDY